MKLLAWCAWGLFLLAIVLVPRCDRDARPDLIAARDLKANRLLAEGDVTLRGGAGYLRRAIARGAEVRTGDLAPNPDLAVKAGRLAVALPIAPPSAGWNGLNAGEEALLCPPAGIKPRRVKLLTRLCHPGSERCVGVVEMTPSQATALARVQALGTVALAATCDPARR
jgi:hypothetical protein